MHISIFAGVFSYSIDKMYYIGGHERICLARRHCIIDSSLLPIARKSNRNGVKTVDVS